MSVRSSARAVVKAAVMGSSRMLSLGNSISAGERGAQEKTQPFRMSYIHPKHWLSRRQRPRLPPMKRAQPNRKRAQQMIARRLRSAAPRIAAATLKPTQLLALQAFDVAVRLGSFKDTADALNLSASAVSHRIRNLEQALGAALFVRNHRAIEPTAEGRALAAATGRAFAELARVDLPSGGAAGRQRLKLKVFPLFASAWLIPRLAGFVAKHPDIDLAIETSNYTIDFDVEAFDAGISVGDGSFAGLDALHLAPLRRRRSQLRRWRAVSNCASRAISPARC